MKPDNDAKDAAQYYRKLIAEGVPTHDAVKMTAAWIGSQVISEKLDPDREPWQE